MAGKTTLQIVNAAEDYPRLVRAYGKQPGGGEFALVLRPGEGLGGMVTTANGGAAAWRVPGSGQDVPRAAGQPMSQKDAVALMKELQRNLPKQGQITLRGQWSGSMSLIDGQPRLELKRVLGYVTVFISSDPQTGHWQWSVKRKEQWYGRPGEDTGTAGRLLDAIQAGTQAALGLMKQVCDFKDSHRRAAVDEAYAVSHPVKPARESKDKIETWEVKEPKPPKEKKARTPKPAREPKQPKPGKEAKAPKEAKSGEAKPAREPKAPKQPRKKPADVPTRTASIDPFGAAPAGYPVQPHAPAPHQQPVYAAQPGHPAQQPVYPVQQGFPTQPGFPTQQQPTVYPPPSSGHPSPHAAAAAAAPGAGMPVNPEFDQMLMGAMMKQLENLDLSKIL